MTAQLDLLATVDTAGWTDQFCAAVEAMPRGSTFTAYDVAERFALPPAANPDRHPGLAMSAARRRGLVRPVGAVPSRKAETRGSLVRLWERL